MALGAPQAGQRGLTTSRVLCHSPKVAQSLRVGSRGCPVPCADPADAAEPARQVPHSSAAEASCVHRSCTERAAQWHDVPEAPGRSTGTRRNHHCTLAGPGHGPCAMTSMRRPGGQNWAFFKFKEAARRLHIDRCMARKLLESLHSWTLPRRGDQPAGTHSATARSGGRGPRLQVRLAVCAGEPASESFVLAESGMHTRELARSRRATAIMVRGKPNCRLTRVCARLGTGRDHSTQNVCRPSPLALDENDDELNVPIGDGRCQGRV